MCIFAKQHVPYKSSCVLWHLAKPRYINQCLSVLCVIRVYHCFDIVFNWIKHCSVLVFVCSAATATAYVHTHFEHASIRRNACAIDVFGFCHSTAKNYHKIWCTAMKRLLLLRQRPFIALVADAERNTTKIPKTIKKTNKPRCLRSVWATFDESRAIIIVWYLYGKRCCFHISR